MGKLFFGILTKTRGVSVLRLKHECEYCKQEFTDIRQTYKARN